MSSVTPWAPWDTPAPPIDDGPSRGRQWLTIALVSALIITVGGGGLYWVTADRRAKHPHVAAIHYPARWDPRVAKLVSFVQRTRGLQFEHPVAVRFLSEAAFKKRVTASPTALTKSDRADLANTVAFLRSLGLIAGKTDLFASVNKATDETTLAFYDPKDKTITVRGTRLNVAIRVTLVHEMTHALQDQHFDLQHMKRLDHGDESGAIDALIEGDATNSENAYVKTLSTADKRQYDKETAAQSSGVDLKGVPPVVQILFDAPYQFGPPFVEVLRANGGEQAVDAAFRHPPTTQEYIYDPTTYITHDKAEVVARPAIPGGAKKFDDGKFDPIGWYIVLAEHIDAHEALRATDGWGGDRYVSYRTREGRVCTRISFRGETARDTREMQDALQHWIASVPGIVANVRGDGTTLRFESCDPGPQAKVATGRSLAAMGLPVGRVSLLQVLLQQGATLAVANCVANDVIAQATVAEINDPNGTSFTSPAGVAHLRSIGLSCRNRFG
ncbi:MAG: hypothetical protein JWL83_1866 [Actinomycetia bacterium]|nr:hypothetical protein [Actinomycetes bacterium]